MIWEMILLYGALVNIAAFVAFALDKRAARNGAWRIREATLLHLAFIGGTPGALMGQRVLRHKTRKEPFRSRLLLICAFHIACAAVFLIPELRGALLVAIGSALKL